MTNKKLSELKVAGIGIPGSDTVIYGVNDASTTPSSKAFNWPGHGINVKDYGAVGDGIADDTAAIQACADALRANGGGALYFPSGTYKITSTITFDMNSGGLTTDSLNIYGDGGKSRINYPVSDGTNCFYFLGNTSDDANLHIHDLRFTGNGLSDTGTGSCIRLRRCIMQAMIDNISIEKFGGGSAIIIESSWLTTVQNCFLNENKYGLFITNDSVGGSWGSTVNTKITNCHVQHNTSHGIYIPEITASSYTINHLSIDNCIVEGNGGGGIVGYGCQNLSVNGVYFETNNSIISKADIYLEFSIFVTISHCGSHFSGSPYPSLTLVSPVSFLFIYNCNWQGVVDLSGGIVLHQINSSQTNIGTYMNNILSGRDVPFVDGDTTPSVYDVLYNAKIFTTSNTSSTTISAFDDGYTGQEILIYVNDANTTFQFSGGYLRGNDGSNYVASNGDAVRAINYGGYWYCTIIQA